MKREFLEELGLNKPIIDAIMSEYGKSVSVLKEKCKELENKDVLIASLTTERDGLVSSLALEGEKHSAFKNGIIDGIVKDARPSSALAEREIRRILSECESGALKDELEKIKESDPDAFKRDEPTAPIFCAFGTADAPASFLNYRSVR